MNPASLNRSALAALTAIAILTGCTRADDRPSVLGTKFVRGPCAVAGGDPVEARVHERIEAENQPLTLVISNGRLGGILGRPQQVQNQDPTPPASRFLDFTLGLREGPTPGTVMVSAAVRNGTACSVELRQGRVSVQPVDPPGGTPSTLTINFGNAALLAPGAETTGTATYTARSDGTSNITGAIDAAVGVVP